MLQTKAILLVLGLSLFISTAQYHDGNHFELSKQLEISRTLQVNDATFEVLVVIEISWDNTFINDVNEIGTIIAEAFKNEYNTNAELYQDPLNRRIENVTVEKATVTPQRFRKLLIGSATFVLNVRAKCRECPRNTGLFNNDAAKRKLSRHMQSLSIKSNDPTSESSLISSPPCMEKISEVSEENEYSLSVEIVSSKKTVKQLSFGETYKECAQDFNEFLDVYKTELSEKVNIVHLKEVINSNECTTNKQCSQGSICIVNQCIKAGKPCFALIWNGSGDYKLQVRAPDGTTLVSKDRILNSLWNVKVITFPSTGGPFGTYIINVETEETQDSKSSTWDLIGFPGQKDDVTAVIKDGIRSQENIFFEFKNL